MGFFPDLFAEKPELLADPTGKKWSDMIKAGEGNAADLVHAGQLRRKPSPTAVSSAR